MRRFYLKIAVIFSAILIVFGAFVVYTSTNASSKIVTEAVQKTNKDLASILADDFRPMLIEELNQEKIEEKLLKLSGRNPQFDFYILGYDGSVKSVVPASKETVYQHASFVDTAPLDAFIAGEQLPILGDNPLNPGEKKPFSVAHVSIMGAQGCYLYIVLEGDQFSQTASILTDSYIGRGALTLIGTILLISLVTGLLIFGLLTRRLDTIKKTVTEFERGQLNERIPVKGNDELSELSHCFNKMADTIVENMKEIENSDKMRRELIANVSHDLRSPLASIQGYLETIEMKGESLSKDELRSYFKTVLNNTKKLNRLIDDLFELTKLDTEQIRPNLENVSMAELVQDLVQQFKPIAEKKGILLEANFPKNPTSLVEADISMLSRAISNLIDNAIEHTPEGGTVSVSSIQDGRDVVLEISDTGVGIPEEDIPFIFDRFYQADKSRTNNKGAGLGLAIAQKIFNLHGAEIQVASQSNNGTTFKVQIPSFAVN